MSSINYINQELRITHSCGEIVKDKRRALLPGSSTVTRKAKVFIGEMAYKLITYSHLFVNCELLRVPS
jgi:hypothetical protein